MAQNEYIREQNCPMLSLAAGLKQPYTDSLPLVDGLSPPQQPQRDTHIEQPVMFSFLLIAQGPEPATVGHLVFSMGCRLVRSNGSSGLVLASGRIQNQSLTTTRIKKSGY